MGSIKHFVRGVFASSIVLAVVVLGNSVASAGFATELPSTATQSQSTAPALGAGLFGVLVVLVAVALLGYSLVALRRQSSLGQAPSRERDRRRRPRRERDRSSVGVR